MKSDSTAKPPVLTGRKAIASSRSVASNSSISIPTGATFHHYIDPQRDIHPDAAKVHGLTSEMLRGKPLFNAIAESFVQFIGDATLVIHNASFDIAFINAELGRLSMAPIGMERVVDTLQLARRKHPGAANSLDALCARYGIDNSRRMKHGALLDAEILAEVYAELSGGRQAGLDLTRMVAPSWVPGAQLGEEMQDLLVERPDALPPRLDEETLAAHGTFVALLGARAIWNSYIRPANAAE